MKLTKCVVVAAGGLFVLVGVGAPVQAQTAAPDPVEYLTKAKAVLERACGVCHGVERPLSKTFDKAGWEKILERMHDNGAEVNAEERAQVVAYLLSKNTFEAKCSACHGTDRPLGKSKSAVDWLSTVQRMSGKKPGHLTESEVAAIAAYLSLVRPLP
jgi:mono/diheme cytochrome c family protein